MISIIFLKPNRFWFKTNDGKNIDRRQKEMIGKMHEMIKQLLTPFTRNQIFLLRKCLYGSVPPNSTTKKLAAGGRRWTPVDAHLFSLMACIVQLTGGLMAKGERARDCHPSPLWKSYFCHWDFRGNLILCLCLRHPRYCSPLNFHNLVGSPAQKGKITSGFNQIFRQRKTKKSTLYIGKIHS